MMLTLKDRELFRSDSKKLIKAIRVIECDVDMAVIRKGKGELDIADHWFTVALAKADLLNELDMINSEDWWTLNRAINSVFNKCHF